MGRFINADGQTGKSGELLSHNMFAYCVNNPVNMEDPSGYLSWKTIGCIVAAVAVVTVIAIVAPAAAPVILGAALGAISSATISAIDQINNGNGKIDADKVIRSASFGAASGALGGLAVGITGQYVGNGVIGAVSTYVENPKAQAQDYALSIALNAVAVRLSGAGAQSYENGYGLHFGSKVIINQYLRASAKGVTNSALPPSMYSVGNTVGSIYKRWYNQQEKQLNEYMHR